jgi:hypothetical protein
MIYENSSSLRNELEVADTLCRLWGVSMVKPPGYGVDRYIVDPTVGTVGTVEIKVRTTPRNKYPTYMIDLSKLVGMRNDVANWGSALLVVRWTDWLGYVNVAQWDWQHWQQHPFCISVAKGGRTDRNDPYDIDTCGFIPMSLFCSAQIRPRFGASN